MKQRDSSKPEAPGEFSPVSVSIPAAATFTGLPRTTIYDLIASGDLRTAKIGKRRVVLFDSLREVVRRHVVDGIAPADSARGRANSRGAEG